MLASVGGKYSKEILLFWSLWVCKYFIIICYSSIMSVCFTILLDNTSLITYIHLHLWVGPSGSSPIYRNYMATAERVKNVSIPELSSTIWHDRKEGNSSIEIVIKSWWPSLQCYYLLSCKKGSTVNKNRTWVLDHIWNIAPLAALILVMIKPWQACLLH